MTAPSGEARPLRFGLTSGATITRTSTSSGGGGGGGGGGACAQPTSTAASVTRTPPMRTLFDILVGLEQTLLLLEILFVGLAEFLAEQAPERKIPVRRQFPAMRRP